MKIQIFCTAALGTFLISCSPDAGVGGGSNETGTRSAPATIAADVYQSYPQEGWEKTYAAWGDKGMSRVQRLREAAAETVALDPACDAVDMSDLSPSRSTAPDSPVVYVDCANKQRFYLGESDVGAAIDSEMEKGSRFSGPELISQCTEAVRARLSLPSTLDQSLFSISDRQGTSGNRVIEFNFEAKNRLGVALPATARCIMTTRGNLEVTITE